MAEDECRSLRKCGSEIEVRERSKCHGSVGKELEKSGRMGRLHKRAGGSGCVKADNGR